MLYALILLALVTLHRGKKTTLGIYLRCAHSICKHYASRHNDATVDAIRSDKINCLRYVVTRDSEYLTQKLGTTVLLLYQLSLWLKLASMSLKTLWLYISPSGSSNSYCTHAWPHGYRWHWVSLASLFLWLGADTPAVVSAICHYSGSSAGVISFFAILPGIFFSLLILFSTHVIPRTELKIIIIKKKRHCLTLSGAVPATKLTKKMRCLG